MRIKKDDTVVVITGKDKGKTGKVLKAMPKGHSTGSKHADKACKSHSEGRCRDQTY